MTTHGDGEHCWGEPFWRSTVKVSVTVLPEDGSVESTELGRTTRSELEDREETEPTGRATLVAPLLTKTAVVQMKFDPER